MANVVESIAERLADIWRLLPGIRSAYSGNKRDNPPANFPATIILTGDGAYSYGDAEGAADFMMLTRTFRQILLVKPWQEGRDLEAEEIVRPFLDSVPEHFFGRKGLELTRTNDPLRYVQSATLLSDTGIINVSMAGTAFAGVEFPISVTYYKPIRHSG